MKDFITAFLQKNDIRDSEDIPSLLRAVSSIPWGEGRTIEETLHTKKVGTCTGKHLVLQECLEKLRVPFRPVVCTFRWGEQSIHYPKFLREILSEGEWEHGHNFIQMKEGDQWLDIDVTWDSFLRPFGFRSFPPHWHKGEHFVGVDPIVRRWDGASMAEKKQELIASLTPEMRTRREIFLKGFIEWVDSLRENGNIDLSKR